MSAIVPDVNVLVYAFRADSPEHERYAAWLNQAAHRDTIGLVDLVLAGFVRIVTNPRIMADPAPASAALEFVRRLDDAARSTWLTQGRTAWEKLAELVEGDPGIRGNLVPDAHLASVCLAHRARLATRDRGFARFPGLDWFDPARE
ncbi:MAG: TA system VapC family ribonuclease toxin [Actinomycetaceae bacterium]